MEPILKNVDETLKMRKMFTFLPSVKCESYQSLTLINEKGTYLMFDCLKIIVSGIRDQTQRMTFSK